ncbi:MAG: PTS sugar transporter subunit IIA, partial [Cutibacterium avidum]|nr:PTS sugar transporter subunit IIA [Cutibacterium avidum]
MATIADLLAEGSIDLSLSAGNKNDTIERMVDLIGASGALVDRDVLIKAVRAREDVGTTGLGDGIAIPHGKCDGVDRPALAFARSDEGVDWGAPDGS